VAGFYKHDNESSVSIEGGGFFDHLIDNKLFKNDSR
jgi:hypothetical protein